jgi:hypothetical protein
MRVSFASGSAPSAKVLVFSTATDGGAVHGKGVAVNAQGTVLTTFPISLSGGLQDAPDFVVGFNPGGGFEVLGRKTYTAAGSFTVTVIVTDIAGASAVATGKASVVVTRLSADFVSIAATAGIAFMGPVARFSGGNPLDTIGSYSAIVSWGKGA